MKIDEVNIIEMKFGAQLVSILVKKIVAKIATNTVTKITTAKIMAIISHSLTTVWILKILAQMNTFILGLASNSIG